ncbi:MAG: hypothetical protein HOO91_20030 [Bacteroidales bacterium]|nr:hypothetical protein [Bacteroidales bacterium]
MRLLSKFEKSLCKRILTKKDENVRNSSLPADRQHISLTKLIEDKLEGVCISVCFNPRKVTIHFNLPVIKAINEWIFEIEDILFTTISLIELLEKEGFLLTYQTSSLFKIEDGRKVVTEITSFGKGTESGMKREIEDERYIDLLLKYCIKNIIPTDEFKRFCKRGFIAREEQRYRRQWIIALSALMVSVISSVANLKNFISGETKIKQEQIDSIRLDLNKIEMRIDTFNNQTAKKIDFVLDEINNTNINVVDLRKKDKNCSLK